MPTISAFGYVTIESFVVLGAQTAVTRYLYLVQTTLPSTTIADVLDQFANDIVPSYKALISQSATYRGSRASFREANGLFDTAWEIETFNQGVGGVLGDPLPKQVSGIVTRLGVFKGRKHRGRVYVPFPGEASNDPVEGRPNNTYLTALSTYGQKITDPLAVNNLGNTATLLPGHIVTVAPGNNQFHEWVSYVHRPYWATQRRRGDYGKENESPI